MILYSIYEKLFPIDMAYRFCRNQSKKKQIDTRNIAYCLSDHFLFKR